MARLPSFEPRKLARRATNFFLLGLSLPAVLDLNANSPMDYLRALNALLLEFDAYQQMHPPDGPSASSLSRARIPQMFKRSVAPKNRRTSSAADVGLPMAAATTAAGDAAELHAPAHGAGAGGGAPPLPAHPHHPIAFASSEQERLPGEEYAHLQTPSLPFDPDFAAVFAALCDVLIDCYARIAAMAAAPADGGPAAPAPGLAEVFAKADARLRKLVIAPVVDEFGAAARAGIKAEVAGVAKVVLGGLM